MRLRSLPIFTKASLFSVIFAGIAFSPSQLLADEFDPFGRFEDMHDSQSMGSNNKSVEGSHGIEQAAQALFGSSVSPKSPSGWTNFNEFSNGLDSGAADSIYKESSSYRLRRASEDPLPDRNPFSDRLGDIQRELRPVDPLGTPIR